MLSDDVLEELTRNSVLQPDLARLAWPSISVESKLQLIQALQRGATPSTPDWLADLALADTSPIVRFWAARYAYLPSPAPETSLTFPISPSEGDLARRDAVLADPELLVSACAKCSETSLLFPNELAECTQPLRLLAIRRMANPDFSGFIDWLETAFKAGVPDEELQDCVREFFALPGLKGELELPETEQDPYGAFSREKALTKAWELTRAAGPRTQNALAFSLPLTVGQLGKVKAAVLADLPGSVVDTLLFRAKWRDAETLDEFVALVSANPENYPPEVQKQLDRESDDIVYTDVERTRRQEQARRPDKGNAVLQEVFSLGDRLAVIEARMADLEKGLQEKKGFIW